MLLVRPWATSPILSLCKDRWANTNQASLGHLKGQMLLPDRGSKKPSRRFPRAIWGHRILQSISRRGNCWGGAPMELVFQILIFEQLPQLRYRNLATERVKIEDCLKRYYNWRRLHRANRGSSHSLAEIQLNFGSSIV